MARENSSSSSSKSTPPPSVSEKDLLKFYQRKYEEHQRKEDKYKEKIDRHLKNLVTDRHELEEEVLRRGEKIADLQKALVELQLSVFEERERFLQVSSENEELKRNEEELHESIRQLLAMTHEQDLRDKIIYILKDSNVDVVCRTNTSAKPRPVHKITANQKLKEELDNLKHQLDEVLKVSKNKSDIVLEDCKQALEKSKEKIIQDENRIKELQKKLQELKTLEKNKSSVAAAKSSSVERQRYVPVGKSTPPERSSSDTAVKSIFRESHRPTKAAKSISWENQQYATSTKSISDESQPAAQSSVDSDVLSKLCSYLKDIHLSLILLMKIISKVKNILNSIQATKLYHRFARIPKAPTDLQYFVEEATIHQLETCLRRCTQMAFDINNMYKSLCKFVTLNKNKFRNISGLKSELKDLEKLVREMSVLTADSDLLNVGLRRADFFQALRDSSVVLPDEDRLHCIKDFKKIISNCETLNKTVSNASDLVEIILEKYSVTRDLYDIADSLRGFSYLSSETHSDIKQDKAVSDEMLKQAKSKSLQDLLGIYKRIARDSEDIGLSTERLTAKIKETERALQEEELKIFDDNLDEDVMESEMPQTYTSDHEEIIRKINKTLSKVELLEQGRYLKDEELCRRLAENVNALTEQFKELTQEFNVKSVQEQFSEYTNVTLSKLEELAKQCRNSVIAAEAQIAAHRSNAKHLSEKLRETEELLRESINECLSLKQKMKQTEAEHEMEKYTLISNLKEKLEQNTSHGVAEVIDELVSNFPAYETIKKTPYICMYCRQGPGHKYCEEKIKDLAAECRKFKTQLKLLKQETDQEKSILKNHREIAESSVTDLTKKTQVMQGSLEDLEKRNSSLLEQLKLERNRIKNMERFRRLEIEGFQTDIKLLKAKIKELEKQLLKAVLIFENNHKDIELLKTVQETAQRSEQATATLRRLKAKLYQLENDIKSL